MLETRLENLPEKCLGHFPEKARKLIRNFLEEETLHDYQLCITECLEKIVEKRKYLSKITTAALAQRIREEGWKYIREGHDGLNVVNGPFVERGNVFRRLALALDEIAVSYRSRKYRWIP